MKDMIISIIAGLIVASVAAIMVWALDGPEWAIFATFFFAYQITMKPGRFSK